MKGLVMLAPVIGFPFVFHALSGALVTGAGFFAISAALTPFKEHILQTARNKTIGQTENVSHDNPGIGMAAPRSSGDDSVKDSEITKQQ
jgi:hypothetical protein